MYVFAMMLSLFVPYLIGYLIDNIILARNFTNIIPWFILTLVITIAASAASFFYIEYMTTKKSIENSNILSRNYVKKMLEMPMPLYEKHDKSYYLNVVTNSSFTYGDLHAQIYLELISSSICVLIILAIVFITNLYFGLIFLLFMPLVILSSRLQGGKLAEIQKDAMLKQDGFLNSLKNIIDSKREISILKETGFFARKFTEKISLWNKYALKYRFYEYLMNKIPSILSNAYSIIFLFIGALFISQGALTPGILIMEYQFVGIISAPVSRISEILIRLKANKEHVDRVDEFDASITENNEYKAQATEQEVIFKATDFKFHRDREQENLLFTISDIEIPNKGLFLIKGQNGSGKSLFLNFIFGNIDMKWAAGSYSFAKNLDNETAFLTYPIFFTNGSFRENIFNRDYDKALLDVLNIDFEEKVITTNPVNLSLGQQQKIGLLRVLSMDYKYLFLDEPLSNLDIETQFKLKEYIQRIRKEKAVIIISHDSVFDDLADKSYQIQDMSLVEISDEYALV